MERRQHRDRQRVQGLHPAVLLDRDAKAKTAFLLTPVGGYSRDDTAGTKTWFALPFFLSHRDADSQTRVFSPLYISYWSKPQNSTTRLVTLFYQRPDRRGSTTTIFPLFSRFHDAATDATATLLFPLYFHRSGPRDTTTIVGPVFWRSFTRGGWSGPVPAGLVRQQRAAGATAWSPLFLAVLRRTVGVTQPPAGPALLLAPGQHGYSAAFLPLFFMGDRDGESWAMQFPLFFHVASTHTGPARPITPLGFTHRDRDGWSWAGLIPLVFARSGENRSHFALVPLIWHFRDRGRRSHHDGGGPLLHRRWGDETTDAFFPLIYYRRGTRPGGQEETSFTLFPLVHYRRDAQVRVLATPLFGAARGPNRNAGFIGPYLWYEDKG